jgi:DNA repair photolyase
MSGNNEDYIKGRGAQVNPHNRFDKTKKVHEHIEGLDETDDLEERTKFIEIYPKTIVNKVTSPDIGLAYSMNPYQGCEHGCTYCYARPTHEYWGYSAGLDFEKIILVKKSAAKLLEETFQKKNWEPKPIMLSGNTDCYQPCESKFEITRELLKVFLKYKHPVSIITKNALISRDLDILTELAKLNLVNVSLSITTLNEDLRRVLEPRTATAKRKLETVELLSNNNIPVNVMMAPIIPGLNNHEIFNIVKEISERGALSAYYTVVRLQGPNQQIFTDWVTKNFPDRALKVLNQIREIHGDNLGDSQFITRMKGEGNFSLNIKRQFELARKKYLFNRDFPQLRTDLFERPSKDGQMSLF